MRRGLLPKGLDPRRKKLPAAASRNGGGDEGRPALDLENSLLVDEVAVSEVEADDGKEVLYAFEFRGRVWREADRATLLHLLRSETAGIVLSALLLAARRDVAMRKVLEDQVGAAVFGDPVPRGDESGTLDDATGGR